MAVASGCEDAFAGRLSCVRAIAAALRVVARGLPCPALLASSLVIWFALGTSSPSRAAQCGETAPASSVLYYTNRQRSRDHQLFNGERALDANYRAVQSTGSIGTPVGPATLVPCTSNQAFIAAVRKRFVANAGKRILIYVHGYYTTFAQAAQDVLALQKSLAFRGPVILYSWPSKVTSRLAYVNDESNAEWSAIAFRNLLGTLEREFPDVKISFATHSLGARFAADGMGVLRHVGCRVKCFGRALLFAPDIDSDTLREELGELGLCDGPPLAKPRAAAAVTVYVSNRDVALRQSQKLHGHQRGGQAASEIILCGGVDTVDVGYLKFADSLGHTYQTDPRVIRDAAAAFAGTSPADPKRNLQRAMRGKKVYYELRDAAPAEAKQAS